MADNAPKVSSKAVTPEPVKYDLSGCALAINAKCGACRHFSRMAHPAYGDVCASKGILEIAKPCARFNPDARQINFKSDEHIELLAELLATLPTNKLGVLAAIINREGRTRKRNLHFGEVVYFRMFGGDYISNYRACRIVSADKDYVHVEGKDGFTAMIYRESVLNLKQWKKKRKALKEAKKIKDPNYSRFFTLPNPAQQEVTKILEGQDQHITAKSVKNAKGRKPFLTIEPPERSGKTKRKRDLRTTPLTEIFGGTSSTGTFRSRG